MSATVRWGPLNWGLLDRQLKRSGYRVLHNPDGSYATSRPIGWDHDFYPSISRDQVCDCVAASDFEKLARLLRDGWPSFSMVDMFALIGGEP